MMCQSLPRTSAEATLSRAQVYKTLPAVFVSWFMLVLQRALARMQHGTRNEREARTIVGTLDHLMTGESLPAIMLLLGRLKALTSVTMGEGSWKEAQHYEMVRTNATGILTARDQRNAQRDLREAQSLQGRGNALPARPGDRRANDGS